MTDMQEIQNYLELCANIPGMSSNFQKDTSYRTGDITIKAQFDQGSKPTIRLTDIQKIRKYPEPVCKHARNQRYPYIGIIKVRK